MAKTFVPTLYSVAYHAHKYSTRWQTQLQGSLTTEQYSCLLAWISATVTLLNCIGKPAVNP